MKLIWMQFLTNNKVLPIVCMADIRYIGPLLIKFNMHPLYKKKVRCSKFGWNFLKNYQVQPIVWMQLDDIIIPILMNLNMHIIYIDNVRYSEFGCNILTKNKVWPIVCPIRHVPARWQRAAIRSMKAKIYQDRLRTKRLVCIATDKQMKRQTDGQKERQTNRRSNSSTRLLILMQNT